MRRRARARWFGLRLIPFTAAIAAGVTLYWVATATTDDIRAVLMSIAATYFSIPLLFLGYEFFVSLTKNQLEKDVFEYFKAQIDMITVTVIKHLHEMLTGETSVNLLEFSSELEKHRDADSILAAFRASVPRGYSVCRTFPEGERVIDAILKSSALSNAFASKQKVALVQFAQALVSYRVTTLQLVRTAKTGKRLSGIRAVKGNEISVRNDDLSQRYVILKSIGRDRSLVLSFGDYPDYLRDRLDREVLLTDAEAQEVTMQLLALADSMFAWVHATDSEVLLRPDQFRIGPGTTYNKPDIDESGSA